jgi:small-conductance mechanosensitive channel
MVDSGEESSWQTPEPADFALESGPRRVARWAVRAFILLGCFAFFIAPMLYLSALAFKFNALWLDGAVLLTMLVTYVGISRGIRITRAIRFRMRVRKVRRNAVTALDGRQPPLER